jgi:succinate dehydrogenase/fumarate reductase cytochrome b subunit (b558 family)
VSTASAPDLSLPITAGRSHFLLRRLHSLTGLVFGGYLVVHLIVNAALIEGGNMYQLQVDKIHSLPFLPAIEWGMIFLPIIYHTIYGIWITLSGAPNVGNYPYGKNWMYVLQRISAVIIVFFMAFHVLSLRGLFGSNLEFAATNFARESVKHHFQAGGAILWIIYPVGILASSFHLANGFWAAAITWGLTISAAAQRRWGMACIGLFLLAFCCGILSLIAVANMAPISLTPWLKGH